MSIINRSAGRAVFDRYLTEREEKRLFSVMYAQRAEPLALRDWGWMRLLRTTGIRVGALSKLTVGEARDALAHERLVLRDEISKGGRGYEVRLYTDGLEALRALLRARRAMGMTSGEDEALVVSRRGTSLSVRGFQARMQMWVEEAGLKVAASPHWWRHTLAKRAMHESEARDPQAIVQVLLGHRSRATTAIYTLPDRSEVEETLRRAQPRGR